MSERKVGRDGASKCLLRRGSLRLNHALIPHIALKTSLLLEVWQQGNVNLLGLTPLSGTAFHRHQELELSHEKLSMENRTMQLQLQLSESKTSEMLQSWKSAQSEIK